MALFEVTKASASATNSNISTAIADGNLGSAQSNSTTVTITYDQSAHFVSVNKGLVTKSSAVIRKELNSLNKEQTIETLLTMFKNTRSNDELIKLLYGKSM